VLLQAACCLLHGLACSGVKPPAEWVAGMEEGLARGLAQVRAFSAWAVLFGRGGAHDGGPRS